MKITSKVNFANGTFSIALSFLLTLVWMAQLAAEEGIHVVRQVVSQASRDLVLRNAGFEEGIIGETPKEWSVPAVPGFETSLSNESPLSGNQCATIRRIADSGAPFGNLIQRVDAAQLRGKRVRFQAAVRAEVDGRRNQAQLWLRVDRTTADGQRAMGAFDNMGDRPITNSEWRHYEIVGDVAEDAEKITVGMMLLGKGQAWIDDASLKVVGSEVPLTAKSLQGAGRSGKSLDQLKPGLYEIIGAMRIARPPGIANKLLSIIKRNQAPGEKQYVLIPLPLAYRDQAPISYQLSVEPPSALEDIEIYRDGPVNHVLKGQFADAEKWEHVDIKFKSLVIIGPTDFSAVPKKTAIPSVWSEEARPWLGGTWCADAQHERIKAIGNEIRSKTSDVPEIIQLVQEKAGKIFASAQGQIASLTAVDALDKQGSCTSCANLVAALLRASGVPARVVAGYPSWSGPLQTHYIVEAFVPDYGWYPIESTLGQSPWPNTHQVSVAIIPPQHEGQAKAGARSGIAPGVPYLSLTELPDNHASLVSIGTIEGTPGCDHECRMIRPLTGTPDEWRQAIKLGTSRWQAWVTAKPKLQAAGNIVFGPPVDEVVADTITQVMPE
jgi:hypothetical protein